MRNYIIILLDKLNNVGRIIGQLSNCAAFNQFTQLDVDWYLVLCNRKYDIDFCLSNLVSQLTDGRIILENQKHRFHMSQEFFALQIGCEKNFLITNQIKWELLPRSFRFIGTKQA